MNINNMRAMQYLYDCIMIVMWVMPRKTVLGIFYPLSLSLSLSLSLDAYIINNGLISYIFLSLNCMALIELIYFQFQMQIHQLTSFTNQSIHKFYYFFMYMYANLCSSLSGSLWQLMFMLGCINCCQNSTIFNSYDLLNQKVMLNFPFG